MKRVFTILGVLVALVLVGGLVAVAVMPGTVEVSKMATIKAPAGEVFEQVNRLSNWEAWQPWSKRDATLETTYEGEEAGVGAKSVWTSENSGSGSQEIVESVAGEKIVTALDFGEMGKASSTWTFVEKDGTTAVTWTMTSELDGMAKLFGPMIRSSVEVDYEEGLGFLKAEVEGDGDGDADEKAEAESAPGEGDATGGGGVSSSGGGLAEDAAGE